MYFRKILLTIILGVPFAFFLFLLLNFDNKFFILSVYFLSAVFFVFLRKFLYLGLEKVWKIDIEGTDVSKILYVGVLKRLVRFAYSTVILTLSFNVALFLINIFMSTEEIIILLTYHNSIFLVFLLSLLVNVVLFYFKIFGRKGIEKEEIVFDKESRIKASIINVIKKIIMGILITIIVGMILNFLGYYLKLILISTFIMSSLIYYYYEKYGKYDTRTDSIQSGTTVSDNSNILNAVDNFSELKDNFSGSVSIQNSNYSSNVVFLRLMIKMLNFKIDNSTENRYLSILKINELIREMDNIMSVDANFRKRVNFIFYLFFALLAEGRKAVPMLMLGYLIYYYQNLENSDNSDYLRERLKQAINNYTLKTPVRMAEMIVCWQYLHKIRLGNVPSIKRLPKFVKKRLKYVLENYSPLTLKKAKMLKKSIKLKDLIKILRPKPKNNLLNVLYGGIIQDSKISKLKTTEIVPLVVKSESLIKQKIDSLPLQALMRNLSKINFEDTETFEIVKNKLLNTVSNMDKLRRFINIFDFYIPIFVVPQDDIHAITEKIKDVEMSSLSNELFSPNKISQQILSSCLVNSIIDYLNLSSTFDFTKVEQVAMIIDYLLILDEIVKIKTSKVDIGNYVVLTDYRTKQILNSHIKIEDIIFNEAKALNRQKMKDLLNEIIQTYLNESRINKKISIIVRVDLSDVINLSILIAFLSSIYSDFEIFLYNGKYLKDYTNVYKDLTNGSRPIDKYLKTFCFITEYGKKGNENFYDSIKDYYGFYEKLQEYFHWNGNNLSENFLVLDYYGYADAQNHLEIFKFFANTLKTHDKKIVFYDYTQNGDIESYLSLNNVNFISCYIHPFVIETIDGFFN
ncbi:MAG: hypothetical protein RMJ67_08315 [Elusimicrobiota bacterium]|nr:hypothetical protein [Endomicrobiia bacterium]MDW8166499.1 hypothetical protein [Elusimicrobiota bacterium]